MQSKAPWKSEQIYYNPLINIYFCGIWVKRLPNQGAVLYPNWGKTASIFYLQAV
jgi:hypothetical protein